MRSGFAAATGDIVLVQDADLEYDPAEYRALARADFERKSRRRFRLPIHGRASAPGRLFLAHGRKQIADLVFQHVHKREPHRHGNLL